MGRWKRSLSLAVVCAIVATLLVPLTTFAQNETISANPNSGAPGSTATLTGSGWTPGHEVQVQWSDPTDRRVLTNTAVALDGTFTAPFQVPWNAMNYSPVDPADVIVVDATEAGCTDLSQVCRGPFAFAKFTVTQSPQTTPQQGTPATGTPAPGGVMQSPEPARPGEEPSPVVCIGCSIA
jgi:hypothetical protein